jgi:ubiquinone/menaquinone biosynthesis C-methylase UbiE
MISKADEVKKYFASPGTVATWWREEKWNAVLRQYFDEQLSYVCSFGKWEGKFVLDAGTGFGRFACALASSGAKVSGIDISMDMLRLARSNAGELAGNISWHRGDVEQLPFGDESFDAAVCMETLMHVPQPLAAVKELARVVRPGGIIITGINNRFSLPYLIHGVQIHLKIYRWLRNLPTPYHTNTIRQLRQWLVQADLEVLDEVGIGMFHPGVYFMPFPGANIQLVPDALSKWFLSVEKKHDLGRTWLQHLMKAHVAVAKKPNRPAMAEKSRELGQRPE